MPNFHSFVTKLSKHGYNERRQSLVSKGGSNYGIPIIALCKPSLPCISKRNIFLIVVHVQQSKRHRKLTHTHINWPLRIPGSAMMCIFQNRTIRQLLKRKVRASETKLSNPSNQGNVPVSKEQIGLNISLLNKLSEVLSRTLLH